MYNRFRTAILRNKLSKPTRILLERDLLHGDILDYGTGYGSDVDILRRDYGFNTYGFDKFNEFYNKQKLLNRRYDAVICNYVFNVIEDLQEHSDLIKELHNLSDTIYISVRSDFKSIKPNWEFDIDSQGWWTTSDTFQRFYDENLIDNMFSGNVEYIVSDSNMKLFRLLK